MTTAAPRLAALDVLRALAVLLVIGRHAPLPAVELPAPVLRFMLGWYRGGWIGVDLFFVLSGFLISGLLFREHERFGRIRPVHFWIRRGLKIYPAFYVLWVVALALMIWNDSVGEFVLALLCEALFVQNYGPSVWSHTWTLAVEEHFYFALPPLLMLVLRKRAPGALPLRALALISGALLTVCLALRCASFRPGVLATVAPTHLRIDALFFGVLLSAWYHADQDGFVRVVRAVRWLLLPAGVALLAPNFLHPLERTWYIQTFGLTANSLGSGTLLLWALHGAPRTAPAAVRAMLRGLARIGEHSYSIYLWHLPAFAAVQWAIVQRWLPQGYALFFAVYLALSLALGIGMAKLIELPVLRLRDRLFPSRSRALVG